MGSYLRNSVKKKSTVKQDFGVNESNIDSNTNSVHEVPTLVLDQE